MISRKVAVLVTLLAVVVTATTAVAFGPGIHLREADRTLERLIELDPSWGDIADEPMAISYLHLGSISPDLDGMSETLNFGHGHDLSYYLLDRAAEEGPLYRMFALGHLCHNGSDASAHAFTPQTLFATAPIGMVDLFEDFGGARGESEAMVESLGDILLGDWNRVVDLAYDFRLDGEEAWDRAVEILTWYCEQGGTFYGNPIDCEAMLAEFEETMAPAEEYIGSMSREDAKALLFFLIDRPVEDLVTALTSAGIASLYGDRFERSEHFDRELARIQQTALMDLTFWSLYEDAFFDLGPTFTLDHLEYRVPNGWPEYDGNSFICGNIQSIMQFLPESFTVVPGLLVDGVVYTDQDGHPITSVGTDLDDAVLDVHVRFYSALPFEGTVRGVVRRDHPGFDQALDEVGGEAEVEVTIDPQGYTLLDRSELVVPFTVDTTGVLGFYTELYVDEEPLPCFTTSWDRLWYADELELDQPVYRDNFGTYGHWPPSLPVTQPDVQPADLFVKVRIAPDGTGIDQAIARLEELEEERTSGPNGIVIFSDLEAGLYHVSLRAPEYQEPQEALPIEVAGLEMTWLDVALHAIPRIDLAGDYWPFRDRLWFAWNMERFGDQAHLFLAQVVQGEPEVPLTEVVELAHWGEVELPLAPEAADGSTLRVRLQARYVDDTLGLEGWSPDILVDGSPPSVEQVVATAQPLDGCVDDPGIVGTIPIHQVTIAVREPHSPLTDLRWRIGESEWNEVEEGLPADPCADPIDLGFSVGPTDDTWGENLEIQVTNAAGLDTSVGPVELTVWDESALCQPELDPEPEPGDMGDAGAEPTRPGTRHEDGGCSLLPIVPLPRTWILPVVLWGLAWCWRRRVC